MIGYYVHHAGSGHLHRSLAITAVTDLDVTGLSTLPRPADWRGDWIQLPDDAAAPVSGDLTVNGRLHYVPARHDGIRQRAAAISAWIQRARPTVIVVDVSVEVALLARLHGIPVVTLAMPGDRSDPAHDLGYGISDRILAAWPPGLSTMWSVPVATRSKVVEVGAISRFVPVPDSAAVVDRRVVVLNGNGGAGATAAQVGCARAATPGWEWIHLDRASGTWVEDPWPLLRSAAVVVSHCGQNAVAEIAAARRPAVLMPQHRPFDEQRFTADTLTGLGWPPVVVRDSWPADQEWPALLEQAGALDGSSWAFWNDGGGAGRAAAILAELDDSWNERVSA